MNFTDIENTVDDTLLINPIVTELPELELHQHNKYLKFDNALSEYNTDYLKELVKFNLAIKDYKVLNTLDSLDLENALSAKLGNELLKRIQGISENSDATSDPFVLLIANNEEQLKEILNTTVNTGYYRIKYGSQPPLEFKVWKPNQNTLLQTVNGFIRLYNNDVVFDINTNNTFFRTATLVEAIPNWNNWQSLNGSNIVKKIDENTTTITNTKEELINRIQGTSENSNAMRDPFKSLGIINSIEEMLSLLDGLCSDVAGTNDYGKFRINLNGVNVYVTNYILGRDYQVFAQEIYAPIEIKNVVGEEKSYLTADESAANYVHITRKYVLELQMVTNYRETGNSRTLRRTHHKSYGWSNWVDTSNPYITSPLYGKNILLLGGSFAHNMRAFAGGLGFTIDKKDYSMQNYLAEQLGLNHLDNFAIQGEGSCITKGVFLKRNTLEQFKLAAQKAKANNYSYDAIILVGGLNDFQMCVPVGKSSDAITAGTFCAGLKALTNEIRATYSTAKILFTTPFKCTRSEPWEDAFWNPLSKKTNSAGCRFAEYIQAIKEVAHLRSIPLLDIYSICQIDTHNAGKLLLSDLVHPNGQGYLTVAPAMLDFIAWQKGADVFSSDALLMNLKQELSKSIDNKETEFLARIQGTSENSNAMKDPFKFVGSFNTNTIDDFRAWLDNLHGTSSGLDNRGFYRAILNDSVIEITSSPINYTTEEYIQVVRGRVSVASTTGLLTFSYEYNILERKYSATDGWSSWRVVASADKFEDLYAEAIQIGSFEVESLTDGIGINFSNIDGTQSDSFEIPVVTSVSAGVMSAVQFQNLTTLITQMQDLIARVEALENQSVVAEVSSNVLTFTNGAEVETNNLALTGNNIDITDNNLNIK